MKKLDSKFYLAKTLYTPSFSAECKTPSLLSELNALSGLIFGAWKKRWKCVRKKADEQEGTILIWNPGTKCCGRTSPPESCLEIFTFNGFRGQRGWTSGQVDKAPLRVFGLLLRRGKRRRNEDFHSDAISRELTLRRGRRGTEAYRIGLLAISVKTCESAAKGEVQSH